MKAALVCVLAALMIAGNTHNLLQRFVFLLFNHIINRSQGPSRVDLKSSILWNVVIVVFDHP